LESFLSFRTLTLTLPIPTLINYNKKITIKTHYCLKYFIKSFGIKIFKLHFNANLITFEVKKPLSNVKRKSAFSFIAKAKMGVSSFSTNFSNNFKSFLFGFLRIVISLIVKISKNFINKLGNFLSITSKISFRINSEINNL
jgi:hypothetical protein